MKDGAAGGVWRTARAGSWNQEGGREREDRGRQRADGGVQSPEQGSREIETSKPQNLKTSKPQNLKTSKPKSRKAEKPKSRKAEKPKSPAPPRHQRIETESAGRAARAGGSPDKHAARSRRVLGPPRPDAVFARGASAAAHAALW
ncbi:hypothetical protein DR61_4941 [Burkholderia pseudomallei]|uniref:hypothetical protein n=1 Tax=Burkholderia pseudomallei TaxID=28450 RepID=UPI00050EC1B4|nr:hypothetical protein [Burkholderia pseudomallei]AIS48845.1 hypothetical protein DR61_4941 [Burkholderia pseudomallei]KGD19126.1 hypothetical protein DR60_2783 [Burkholderia pseudomallei]CAJ5216436.1 Uncharacterised protein [Burkholderia pseudomallei]CAJ8084873.1 Uncharacterised protein [Burkholderia pseudomallei]VBR28869.1 Uncharacterised protein [Burkholderia pseudomallei]